MIVILDAEKMTDKQSTHAYLKETLDLPVYYGNNLDALYDVLSEICEDTQIILRDPAAVAEQMGKYGEALLATMQEAAEENPRLTVTLQ